MDLGKLDELKRILVSAEKISDIWDFFLTNLGEVPEFHNHGELVEHEVLRGSIIEIANQLFEPSALMKPMAVKGQKPKPSVVMQQFRIVRVPGTDFYHGGCILNNCLANYIFFEDIGMGAFALMPHPLLGGKLPNHPMVKDGDRNIFSRFTVAKQEPGKTVMVKPHSKVRQ